MELKQLFERTVEIRQVVPAANVKRRLAAAAQELSLAGSNQARVELLNEALLAFTTALYETDNAGRTPNVDRPTGRILMAKPWGSGGWRRWGLRHWEATILRRILILRCDMRRVQPLFDFARETNQWYLNGRNYGRLDLALAYWRSNPVTLRDWYLFADAHRQQARDRMEARRTI